MRITRDFLIGEIKKIYKYIEDNPHKGSLMGPVTSAIVKLHQDIRFITVEEGRNEVGKEIYKLKQYIDEKLAAAQMVDDKKKKLAEMNRRGDKNGKKLI